MMRFFKTNQDEFNLKLCLPICGMFEAKLQLKTPGFAVDYLDGHCKPEENQLINTEQIREVKLMPQYLKHFSQADLKNKWCGHASDLPFGPDRPAYCLPVHLLPFRAGHLCTELL